MITIITDSSSEMLAREQKKYGVKVLPMPINFGEATFLSGEDISNEEFYDRLLLAEKLPTTSMVNTFNFKAAFKQEIARGNDVIAIVISSHMSVTFQQAEAAAAEVGRGRVFVVDSKNASLGQTAIVLEAVRLRDEGKTVKEIYEEVSKMTERVRLFAMVDTLKYLRAGGRLSGTAAAVGTMLQVKPILTVEDGKVVNKGKAIGKNKAFRYIVSAIKEMNVDKTKSIVIAHACDNKVRKEFEDVIARDIGIKPTEVVQIGSTIGVHIGHGAVGVSFFER